jgi:tripartite-type tricarboxylate transporter receptor subunit TctC
MNLRRFGIVMGLFLVLTLVSRAWAIENEFPTKPIIIIVPYPAGGGVDTGARGIAPYLRKYLKVPIMIENVPGANGKIGITKAWKANPDGYTLVAIASPLESIVNEYLFSAEYKTKDFTPIFGYSKENSVLVVNIGTYKTLDDLVNDAKKRVLSTGISAKGAASHVNGLLLVNKLGLKVNWVPFGGGAPSLTALAGKHIDFAFAAVPAAIPLIRGGKLRPLLVFSDERDPFLPEAMLPKETGYDFTGLTSIRDLLAPPKVPARIVEILEKAFEKAVVEPKYREWAKNAGVNLVPISSRECKNITEEQHKIVEELIQLIK